MTNGHEDYGGAFAHCVFFCMYKRLAGCRAAKLLDALQDYFGENNNNPFLHYADWTSPGDIIAGEEGLAAADRPGSCVDECKKVYPPLTRK